MPGYGSEKLEKRFKRGTYIVVGIEPLEKQRNRHAPDQVYFVVTGAPCDQVGPYLSGTVQARAIELIFDDEGDPWAEAALFNKLFGYAQVGQDVPISARPPQKK